MRKPVDWHGHSVDVDNGEHYRDWWQYCHDSRSHWITFSEVSVGLSFVL